MVFNELDNFFSCFFCSLILVGKKLININLLVGRLEVYNVVILVVIFGIGIIEIFVLI